MGMIEASGGGCVGGVWVVCWEGGGVKHRDPTWVMREPEKAAYYPVSCATITHH